MNEQSFSKTALQIIVTASVCFLCLGLASEKKTASGIVFEDKNLNGVFDIGDSGIPNVLVSNQIDVVKTNKSGEYALSVGEETIIFITKPAGYQVPFNENNLPQFYYIHQPAGSPAGLKFKGIEPTGELPESINFPLIKTEIKTGFSAIISGDPQPRNEMEVSYFRDDVVLEMTKQNIEFYLALGDIAYDDLNIYDQYNRAVAQIGVPAYNVHGNHDMNFRVSGDRFSAETFKRVFGPPDYSFDYGKVHFIVLDDVEYFGWDEEKNQKGLYRGYLNEQQLQWLKHDLAHVPDDYLVVLAMHIPISSTISDDDAVKIVNREDLFEVLKNRKNLLAVFAHMHAIEHLEFAPEIGWHGAATCPGINTGAACGAWWSGPKDARSIPESICMDGSPNGFFVFSFEGNQYNTHFYPANRSSDYQMRISKPSGILCADSLAGQQIVVNVFNGSPETVVTYQMNEGPPNGMERVTMKDPFMEEYVIKNRATFPDWLRQANPVNHIWTARLPDNLKPGTHTLRIKAVDHLGNIFTGGRIFEIKDEKF